MENTITITLTGPNPAATIMLINNIEATTKMVEAYFPSTSVTTTLTAKD